MSSLKDQFLSQPTAVEPKYTTRSEFDGQRGFIQTKPTTKEYSIEDYDDILRECGFNPDKVRIVGSPRVSNWGVAGTDERLHSYRFHIEAIAPVDDDEEEIAEIAERIKREIPKKRRATKKSSEVPGKVRVLQIGDTQLGKRENGEDGVEDVLRRIMFTIADFRNMVGPNDHVAILFVGDACEGCVSQGGKNMGFQTVLPITRQTEVLYEVILELIYSLYPYCKDLTIGVVGGNHDEATRSINTFAGDNWAVSTAVKVDKGIRRNPTIKNVRILVPPHTQGHMTFDVAGEVIHMQHGHKLPRPYGVQGMKKWCEKSAFYETSAAGASVYAIGHGHTFEMSIEGGRTFIQSCTSDSGSDWFADMNGGAWQHPFATSYTITRGKVNDVHHHYEVERD